MAQWSKNTYIIEDKVAHCLTTKDESFQVSEADSSLIELYTWSIGKRGYLQARINKKNVYLHRLVMDEPEGFLVDHVNGVKTDCRRENLRLATAEENMANLSLRTDSTSGHRGISWNKKKAKWEVRVQHKGKTYRLGFFNNIEAGVKAYETKARELYGEFANRI